MTEPSDAATRDPRGRFVPGVSGNPAGMKPGTHHRRTRLSALLEEGEFETIGRSIIEKAKAGHRVEEQFLVGQLDPKPRQRTIEVPCPDGTLEERYRALYAAAARGEIAPAEAAALGKLLEGERRLEPVASLADAERRIAEANRGAQEARDEAGRLQARLDAVIAAFDASQSGAAAAAKRAAEREVALRSACVCRQNGITPPVPRGAGASHHTAPVTPRALHSPRHAPSEPAGPAAAAVSARPASSDTVATIEAPVAEAEARRAVDPARSAARARETFIRAFALASPPPMSRHVPRSPPGSAPARPLAAIRTNAALGAATASAAARADARSTTPQAGAGP